MSRITNVIAEGIATRLSEKKSKAIDAVQKQINELAQSFHKATIPDEVVALHKKHRSYFSSYTTMYLSGPGLPHCSVKFSETLPTTNTQYLLLEQKEASELVKLINKKADLEKELSKLKTQIKVSLMGLRTYKNIETNFPEAFKLLPSNPATTAVAIDLKSLRSQLA